MLMQDVYRIVQEPEEKVSNFGIKLKVALDRIMVFHPESLTKDEAAKKTQGQILLWYQAECERRLRYYYEVLQADYTALLTKARSIEAEKLALTSTSTVTAKSANQVGSKFSSGIEDLNR